MKERFQISNWANQIASAAVTVSGALCAISAHAAGSTDAIIEEVVVYGTKKSVAQAAQDVPAQVVAYDSSKLEALHVVTIEDLSFSIPNVQLDAIGTSASYAAFSARGMGVDNSTPSIEPNVGVFVDGTYLGVPFGVVTDTFDLESIEVHKGPQSLLFGRNVTGGAVLLRSRRPDGEFGVNFKAGYESGNQYTGAFAIQGSLVEDVLAVRLAAQFKEDDGWFDNEFLDKDTGQESSNLVRLSALYTPGDVLELTFIAEDGSLDGDGTPVQNLFADPPISPLDTNGQYTWAARLDPPTDSHYVFHDFVGEGKADWTQFTFETVFSVGEGQITNTMSYREVDAFSSADVDARETAGINTFYEIDQDQFSNEFRFNITLQEIWDFTVGVSYFEQEYEYMTGLVVGAPDNDFGIVNGSGHRRGGGRLEQETYSIYINNEMRLTDSFSLIGGFNYSSEEKDVAILLRLPPASITVHDPDACDYALGCDFSLGVPADEDWSNVSPKIGFAWWPEEDIQVYGHVSRAYRSGFYNFRQTNGVLLSPGPNGNGPEPTDVEEHTAYELGIKSRWADGTIRLNAAVFLQEIEDLARSTGFSLPDGNPAQDLINVGDAEIAGFEADLQAQLIDNLVVELAVGYLDGDITDAKSDINRRDGITAADEALGLVRLSQWTASGRITYDQPIGDNNTLTLSADYGYRSRSAARDDNPAYFPKQNMIGFDVRFGPNDARWAVSVYGKNLRDDVVYKSVFPLSSGRTFAPIAEGRRYGVEFNYEM